MRKFCTAWLNILRCSGFSASIPSGIVLKYIVVLPSMRAAYAGSSSASAIVIALIPRYDLPPPAARSIAPALCGSAETMAATL